jgi:hypothetical protein
MPAPQFMQYVRKALHAARRADASASEAQREAGNSRVGKLYIHGLELSIEWPKGAVRKGTDSEGKSWTRPMHAHYGRINRTTSPHDGDHVDFYLGEHPDSQIVFVVDQLDKRGNLDEHKCIIGCKNVAEAKKLYLAHYPDWWKDDRMGEVRGCTMQQFKQWLASDNPVKNRTKKANEGEDCPHCGASMERGEDGICNRCGEDWPLKAAAGPSPLSALSPKPNPLVSLLPKANPAPFMPKPVVPNLLAPRPSITLPKTPVSLPAGTKLSPAPVVPPAGTSFAPDVKPGLASRVGSGLKWYGGELAGVSKEDLAAKPIRTAAKGVYNTVTTPVTEPFTKDKYPVATKWMRRGQTAATYGPPVAAAATLPWAARKSHGDALEQAAMDSGARAEDVRAMRQQFNQDYFPHIAQKALPPALGGDDTWVGKMQRDLAGKTMVMRWQDKAHRVNTNPTLGTSIIKNFRNLTPGGAATNAALRWWGEPKQHEIDRIYREALENKAQQIYDNTRLDANGLPVNPELDEANNSPLLNALKPSLSHLAKPRSAAGMAREATLQYPHLIPNVHTRSNFQDAASNIYRHDDRDPTPAEMAIHAAKPLASSAHYLGSRNRGLLPSSPFR